VEKAKPEIAASALGSLAMTGKRKTLTDSSSRKRIRFIVRDFWSMNNELRAMTGKKNSYRNWTSSIVLAYDTN